MENHGPKAARNAREMDGDREIPAGRELYTKPKTKN
jgi:hypothetical protein